ncbi:hypothetical protein CC80DRAFT_217609 [Byssothecium circinans]|uniref:Uncharacterized protein n=1 Tax=Byssothecium circinans TaxID=147558 RepID=A0A6A5TE77_9PLEO|nr:hypothetical protein CC80DRAFT_217609 [Byssothecium circinans]
MRETKNGKAGRTSKIQNANVPSTPDAPISIISTAAHPAIADVTTNGSANDPAVTDPAPSVPSVAGHTDEAHPAAHRITATASTNDTKTAVRAASDPNVSSKHQEKPRLGLHLLHDPMGQPKVDIVAIHGLGGDAYRTWECDGNLWLRDFLPRTIPSVRVFSFAYPADIWTKRKAEVEDFAQSLLNNLEMKRSTDKDRPIIFVCHSLGGIVCKQALVTAHNSTQYQHLLAATHTIMFLGTPHRGAKVADTGFMFSKVVDNVLMRYATFGQLAQINAKLLETLGYDSDNLLKLADHFTSRLENIRVKTCVEMDPDKRTGGLIVEQASARIGIPGEEILLIWKTHQNMCKYADADDNDYLLVSDCLRKAVEAAHSSRPSKTSKDLEERDKACLRHLSQFHHPDTRSKLLEDRVDGTCVWLLEHAQYHSWNCKMSSALLWITGNASYGKTVLSAYVSRHLEKSQNGRTPHLVCHYFFDAKTGKATNPNEFTQAIIFQIVEKQLELLEHATKVHEKTHDMNSSSTILWEVLDAIVADKNCPPVLIVIDALDECEPSLVTTLLNEVKKLVSKTKSQESSCVKFILTLRPQPNLCDLLEEYAENRIDLGAEKEIREQEVGSVIRQRVTLLAERRSYSPRTKDFVLEALQERAENTFIWVRFVILALEKDKLRTDASIRKIIQTFPSDLEEIYTQFLHQIEPEYQDFASKALCILLGSQRSLDLEGFAYAMAIRDDHKYFAEVTENLSSAIGSTLRDVLGPLVEVSECEVSLAHLTMKEFLLIQTTSTDCPLPVCFRFSQAKIHGELASICLTHQLLQDNPSERAKSSQFMEYVFTYWICHYVSCQLQDEAPEHLQVRFWEYFSTLDEKQRAKLLVTEAAAGMAQEANFLLERGIHPDADYGGTTAFRTAISHSRPEVIELLLNDSRTTIGVLAHDRTPQGIICNCKISALTIALRNKRLNLAKRILDDPRFDFKLVGTHDIVEAMRSHCGTLVDRLFAMDHVKIGIYSLTTACQLGDIGLVQRILEYPRFDWDHNLSREMSPVYVALQAGHVEIAKMLLSTQEFNVNAVLPNSAPVLSLCAKSRDLDSLKFLLKWPGIEVNKIDQYYLHTPLIWAVWGRHLGIVREFVGRKDVDLNCKGTYGQTALSFAAEAGDVEIVKELLGSGGVDASIQDNMGRNAISWARKPMGLTHKTHLDEIVSLLLEHGCPDLGPESDLESEETSEEDESEETSETSRKKRAKKTIHREVDVLGLYE